MSNTNQFPAGGHAPAFHGNPVFNGPVLFNSTWNAEANVPSNTEEKDEKFDEDELDANVEECSLNDYEENKDIDGIYPITTHPKGRILILNNEFKNAKMKRKGSLLDVCNMMVLWQSLGFAVEIVSDLTSEGMQQAVREFVTSESMRKANICAIFVMSHGEKDDFIVGAEETRISVMNIVEEVKKSQILHGKPKLLFFQMCRGSKAEKYKPGSKKIESDAMAFSENTEESDSENTEKSDSDWFRKMLDTLLPEKQSEQSTPVASATIPKPYHVHQARVQQQPIYGYPQNRIDSDSTRRRVRQVGSDGPRRIESDGPRSVESDATAWEYTNQGGEDLMIAFATKPDHVAFRGQDGSWFVSAIANQFKQHAKHRDLIKLMELVKDEVCKKRSYTPTAKPKYHDCVAAVEASDTFLGKRLYFFPGYPNMHE